MTSPQDKASEYTPPQPHSSAVLQISQLGFSYPGQPIFQKWSMAIPPGLTLIRGGDGRGKSSLLGLLAGQLPADAGELKIHGVSLQKTPEAYRAQLCFIDPRSVVFDQLTPLQYFDTQRQFYPAFDNTLLCRLVDGLALEAQLHKQLYMLSTGSKRKVFLAAAFASGAPLTLLDMPFAALDKASIACVMHALESASVHEQRACVMADYTAPAGLRLACLIELGD